MSDFARLERRLAQAADRFERVQARHTVRRCPMHYDRGERRKERSDELHDDRGRDVWIHTKHCDRHLAQRSTAKQVEEAK